MSDGNRVNGLRERLASGTEDKLGKALTDLFDNPLVSGTIGRAFDARERAAQAQELALSALNIPTAADIERLTRRLRSVSQRLEGIEDGVHRLNRALSGGGVERRLAAMEEHLKSLSERLAGERATPPAAVSGNAGSEAGSGKAGKASSGAASSDNASSEAAGSGKASSGAMSSKARSSKAKSGAARSGAARSGAARSSKARSGAARSRAARSGAAKSGARQPAASGRSAAKPAGRRSTRTPESD